MRADDIHTGPDSVTRRARRLRIVGIIVLVLGVGGAGLVYWMGTRSPDVSDDISMLGYNKAQTRQMEQLYGKSGLLIEEWTNDLKQPGTQATIIAAVSMLVAVGCFYFARLLENDNAITGGNDLHHGG
ncbi:MAG: hypothetical protein ABSB84_04335 [Verrucomicrobiota bacterium]|jgi:hypothetical protein